MRAIRAVAAGGTYVDPSLAGALTPREVEVLHLVARGHGGKEVAAALAISSKAVETHKANAMARLGLGGRAALVRLAIGQGWLTDR